MTKQEQGLIDGYKKNFLQVTGKKLHAYPLSRMVQKTTLNQLHKAVNKYVGYNITQYMERRDKKLLADRYLFILYANKMGFTDGEIADYIGKDRSTISTLRSSSSSVKTQAFRSNYKLFKEYMNEEIKAIKIQQNTRNTVQSVVNL